MRCPACAWISAIRHGHGEFEADPTQVASRRGAAVQQAIMENNAGAAGSINHCRLHARFDFIEQRLENAAATLDGEPAARAGTTPTFRYC
jgi:hypothetical protein